MGIVGFAAAEDVSVQPVKGDATVSIQAAIDRVAAAGGGRVSLATGVYAMGGIRLRSNVELHLEKDVIINASRNCDDFAVQLDDRPGAPKRAWSWNDGIIRIYQATNVAITGEAGSVIDGHNSFNAKGEEHYRGAHGICADRSTNVTVRGVTVQHTGNWATRFYDSADLVFEDLRIRGGHDGVHVRGCDRVRVARCDIRSGDDAVAGFDNNDVTVTDCSLNSACSAFRFGGTHVRVSGCRVWGPAEWPFRHFLSAEEKRDGVSSQGRGRANLLSFWTYFADFTRPVRNPPGDIVITDCTVENADRLLHYNFSGNEPWQQGAPLGDIRFERIRAKDIGSSLCAYADASRPLALTLNDCDIAFREPQREFIRAASVGSVTLRDVTVQDVEGPCVRTWVGEPTLKLTNMKGAEPLSVRAAEPFKTPSI